MKTLATLCIALLLALIGPAPAMAQSYPAKPIRLLVPFPPGGPADVLARVIAQQMAADIGQPVVVDNRPGANTIIAAQMAAKSPPDGYTLLLAIDSTLSMNQHLYTKLPYDPVKDFAPVGLVATLPTVVLVSKDMKVNNLQELIAAAKAQPGTINYGAGTITTQLAGELLNSMAGITLTYVPYKGGGTTITALLGGEVSLIIDGPNTAIPNWKAGKVKALAVTSAMRLSEAPEIPTVAESGVPGYDVSVWQSIVVPAGTPPAIIAKLNATLGHIMASPETRERLKSLGIEPTHSTPEQLAAKIQAESVKWGKVIRDIGLKIE